MHRNFSVNFAYDRSKYLDPDSHQFHVLSIDKNEPVEYPPPRGTRIPHLNVPWAPSPEGLFNIFLRGYIHSRASISMVEAMGIVPRDPGLCERPYKIPPHAILRRTIAEDNKNMQDLHIRVISLKLPPLRDSSAYSRNINRHLSFLVKCSFQSMDSPNFDPMSAVKYIQVPEWESSAVSSLQNASAILGWSDHPCPAYTPQPFNFFGAKDIKNITSEYLDSLGSSCLTVCLLALQPALTTLQEILRSPDQEFCHEFPICFDRCSAPNEIFIRHVIKTCSGETVWDEVLTIGVIGRPYARSHPNSCPTDASEFAMLYEFNKDEEVLGWLIKMVRIYSAPLPSLTHNSGLFPIRPRIAWLCAELAWHS